MGKAQDSDQVIEAIGEVGRWQTRHILILASITFFSAVPSLIIKFMSPPSEYWCLVPESRGGDGETVISNGSSPIVRRGGSLRYDQCTLWNSSDLTRPRDNSTIPCTKWKHDRSQWHQTIIQQWDLVCRREHFKNDAQTVFFFGMLVGTYGAGYISDRFGRKVTLIPLTLIMCFIGAILPFLPGPLSFLFLRFWHGFAKIAVYTLVYVWCMEVVGGKWKTYLTMGMQIPWTSSWLLLALFAYLTPDWRHLSWITSIPGLAYFVLFWITPESPKWLLAVGKISEAEKTVRQAARENGKPLPESWHLEKIMESEAMATSDKGNVLGLFRKKNLALKTLILSFSWFANSFVYYGLTLNTGSLGGSLMLNFVMNGLLEIPAYSLGLWVMIKCGRKLPYVCMIATAGISLLCTCLVPEGVYTHNWPIITLAMIGKMCITGSFAIVYLLSVEIFPTVVRSVGIGTASLFGRMGGMVAPYIGSLDEVVNPTFPIVIFGVTALIATGLAAFLPETWKSKLPDTIEEGNKSGLSLKDGLLMRS